VKEDGRIVNVYVDLVLVGVQVSQEGKEGLRE